jgi:hypothetical protein
MFKKTSISKGIASFSVCLLGGYCMWLTDGGTGVGWAILGLLLIWDGGD